jgi:DNA-binding beta-propeller fold protein YncE
MKRFSFFSRYRLWLRAAALVASAGFGLSVVAQDDTGKEAPPSLLVPWTTLTGGWAGTPLEVVPARPYAPKQTGFTSLQLPLVVAARGNFLYMVDGGHRQIFRFDQTQQSLASVGDCVACAATSIAVASDLSLYVADSGARHVVRLAPDGRLLQRFSNDYELTSPVAIVLDESSGKLLVADGIYNHVVVFNSLGRVLQVLKPSQGNSIVAMARGPDGLYLVDRLSRQIVVVGLDGSDRYTLGQGTLKMPNAIAVDRFNRVFVSDIFDNSIKVFESGRLVENVSASRVAPASFNRITGLYLEQNTLFVVDSLNRRILSFHVSPVSPVASVPARAE